MLRTALLAGIAVVLLSNIQGHAQEIRNVRCDKIKLSWTVENQFAVVNAHNGCWAPMYVAVCIPLKSGGWVRYGTPSPVPPGQIQPINVGVLNGINLGKAPCWSAGSLTADDPCKAPCDR